jgi:TolB-like protein/class 3 adenylate cyclase/cytochrome c-type biogenesis protein CcmH/NrfG
MISAIATGGTSGAGRGSATSMDIAALKRKLTTVLVADVVGYSRLMSSDEEGTHARLAGLRRELIEPAIDAHAGVLVKRTGDGVLAEFPSVVEAVRCAVRIQEGAAARNAGRRPDLHIAFRIGINLGDIIIEGDDIYGDGVNVAVRLEGLAAPGGIVVSRAVRDHVRDRMKLRFDDMGEQIVKNIARPVRAFQIPPVDGIPHGKRGIGREHRRRSALVAAGALALVSTVASGAWWLQQSGSLPASIAAALRPPSGAQNAGAAAAERLSIVVMPFANLSGDPRQDYFVDGITESLTTDLSRALPGSFVVARGTAFTYKGRPLDPPQIGRDLNVRYLLAGSVIPDGDRVRVNAQLVDAETDTQLWAERFDKKRQDVLEVQDQIVGRLSRAVGLQVIDIEARRSERARNPSAIDFVMRGQAMANRPTSRQTMIDARALFQQALDYEPDNVDALAGIATTYVFEVLNSYYDSGRDERLRNGEALVRRALALQPRHIVALKANAALFRAAGRFEEAIAASQTVIAQNPGEPWAYKEVGLSTLYLGRLDEALDWFAKADQLGPRDPSRWIWLGAMGRVQFFLGHDEEAIRLLRLSADANPNDPRAYALLAAVHALRGQGEDAKAALADCLRLRPDMTIRRIFDDWSVPLEATSPLYQRQHERIRDGLRLAGMAER